LWSWSKWPLRRSVVIPLRGLLSCCPKLSHCQDRHWAAAFSVKLARPGFFFFEIGRFFSFLQTGVTIERRVLSEAIFPPYSGRVRLSPFWRRCSWFSSVKLAFYVLRGTPFTTGLVTHRSFPRKVYRYTSTVARTPFPSSFSFPCQSVEPPHLSFMIAAPK